MAKVKHTSAFCCTSVCFSIANEVAVNFPRPPTHSVTPPPPHLSLHRLFPRLRRPDIIFRDLQIQFIADIEEILEILGRFFLPSRLRFTLCATGSACVYPAHTELKISRFSQRQMAGGEARAKKNKSVFEMCAPLITHKRF